MTTDDMLDQLLYTIIQAHRLGWRLPPGVAEGGGETGGGGGDNNDLGGAGVLEERDREWFYETRLQGGVPPPRYGKGEAKAKPLPCHLVSEMVFMQRMHMCYINTTMLGYNLANLEVAVNWFKQVCTSGDLTTRITMRI